MAAAAQDAEAANISTTPQNPMRRRPSCPRGFTIHIASTKLIAWLFELETKQAVRKSPLIASVCNSLGILYTNGIPDFQLRDLRHSCATRLSDRGEELVTVAEILGHTDIRMTKRYSHGMQERKREALEKLVSFGSRQRDAKNLKNEKRQGARPAVSS
jgi:integrase